MSIYRLDSVSKSFISVPHPQGVRDLKHVPCGVMFDIYVPNDIEASNWAIWRSSGIHQYTVPPPSQTPTQIMDSMLQIVRKVITLTIIINKWFINGYEMFTNYIKSVSYIK